MSKPVFDYRETTITFDYVSNTVEFYFTKENDYIRCLKRNPDCLSKQDLEPGYIVVYSINDVRKPELLLMCPSKRSSKGPYKSVS